MRDIDVCNRSASGHVKKQILLVGQFCSQCDGKEIRTSLHKKSMLHWWHVNVCVSFNRYINNMFIVPNFCTEYSSWYEQKYVSGFFLCYCLLNSPPEVTCSLHGLLHYTTVALHLRLQFPSSIARYTHWTHSWLHWTHNLLKPWTSSSSLPSIV